jgi:hypothetical protein
MYYLEIMVYGLRFILAPIHELGHVVFGWLSLNPTKIVAWNKASALRDGWFMSLGGMVFEFLAVFLIAYFVGKKTKYIYLYTIAFTMVILAACNFQSDRNGYGPLMLVIWYIIGFASLAWQVIYLIRGISWQETKRLGQQGTQRTRQAIGGAICFLEAIPTPSQALHRVLVKVKGQK